MRGIDGTSLSLLTDLYQLTMGYGYWRNQIHTRRSVFHLFFRRCPFGGQYAIAAGLEPAIKWLLDFQVTDEDASFLGTLCGNDNKPLFAKEFLAELKEMRLEIDVDAIPEGTMSFAHEPLLRITGPLWQCQWVETALLNIVNFQTLIATKASRVCDAAQGESVLEFGLRRAQGIDGAISAARAAYVGGCAATSNVLAGKMLGIPVKGTHAHSWVMSFDDEPSAFAAYARAMPNNCVFLVDTYDTIQGVRNAIEMGRHLRDQGHKMVGIRLDSGDLAQLSIEARQLLDDAGFPDSLIVASNDLDEYSIEQLKKDGATIAVWGVGTNLVTARDQPALGGVYKLAAIETSEGQWQPRIKLSEQPIKTSNPGIQQVRRYFNNQEMIGDTIYSELIGPPQTAHPGSMRHEDLLRPILRDGKLVDDLPSLDSVRERASQQRQQLSPELRQLREAPSYSVQLEPRLREQKMQMIDNAQRLP